MYIYMLYVYTKKYVFSAYYQYYILTNINIVFQKNLALFCVANNFKTSNIFVKEQFLCNISRKLSTKKSLQIKVLFKTYRVICE